MAIKMQAEFGDDLQVIFVESQGAAADMAERFALERKWLGGRAMWTTEAPFSTGSNGLPSFALLSSEGEVLLKGNSLALKRDIEEAVAAEAKARGSAPKGTAKELKKGWAAFAKGDYAKAIEELRGVVADGDEAASAAEDLIRDITRRVEAEQRAIRWMLENGYPLEAEAELEALEAGVGELEDFAESTAELRTRLADEAMEPELEAAKALAKLEKKLAKNGPDEKLGKAYADLAEDHAGTKVAARAIHMAGLMGA